MKKITTLYITLMILTASVCTFFVWQVLCKPNSSAVGSPVYIYPGDNRDTLVQRLLEGGILKSKASFKLAAKIDALPIIIKPGRYIIKEGLNNRQIVRVFKLGLQTPHNLTISGNIRSIERLAAIISSKISSDSASVLSQLTNTSFIDSLGLSKYTFPSIFLLNTYQVYWTATPREIVLRMKREYDKFWDSKRVEMAQKAGLSPLDATILASIVAEESNIRAEHPIIAGVYINRLKIGMPLQADPTVKFALNDAGIRRILFKHLEIDSPYNTYKYKGLPPGPISLPSPHVIDSVLSYKSHKYLYFCAKPSLDGSHSFAATLSEHNKNAREYQRAISRLR